MTHKTFKDAYGTLQQNAQKLRDQQEPNIDDLLHIVTESVAAYKVCKTRIDAVEKALEQALSSTEEPPVKQASQAKNASRPSHVRAAPDSVDPDEQDIPF